MEAKEKASELICKFNEIHTLNNYEAKQCALIAVDELIKEENKYNNSSFYHSKYWQKVKTEIEKL